MILHGAHRASDAQVAAHADFFVKQLASYPAWCQHLAEPGVGDEEAVELDERPAMFSPLSIGGAA